MYIDKSVFVKEFMQCKSSLTSNAEYGIECIGTCPKMRDRTQEFQRVALFLQRVIALTVTLDGNGICMDLQRLFCLRGQNNLSFYNDSTSDRKICQFLKIIKAGSINDDLQICEAASIILC